MRNQFKLLITVLSIALISKYGFSQADISGGTGHVRVAGYYCGWKAGIHLSNHAALAWDNDGLGNFLFMGHPAFNADHSFYCGLATNVTDA